MEGVPEAEEAIAAVPADPAEAPGEAAPAQERRRLRLRDAITAPTTTGAAGYIGTIPVIKISVQKAVGA